MKCMEYSNKHHINIIPQDAFEELAQEVFTVISDNITKSLGPLGSSATIFDGTLVEATKDGYHILDKYIFHNRYKKMIYNLIKTPCTKMNNTVGDGTTTAIALTNELYQLYKERESDIKNTYRLPREFTKVWDEVVEEIIKHVKDLSTQIDPEDRDTVYHLAYISSNGNAEIANAFADTYSEAKSPAIKMKDSPTNKSYIEAVDGFEFPSNVIDIAYVKNQDLTSRERNVATLILDHKLETDEFQALIVPIDQVMRAKNKKLIVIAPEYDALMLDSVVVAYVNQGYQKYRNINLVLTQYSTGKLAPYQREDLAAVLRSIVVNQNISSQFMDAIQRTNIDTLVEEIEEDETSPLYRMVGTADSVLLSMGNGSIFNVSGIEEDKLYQDALKLAEHDLEDILNHVNYEQKSYSSKVYDARSRVMQLKMKNYIYYIGADSELQKQIIHDSVDDVIKCLRSAIKNGVVPGCQISIIRAISNIQKESHEWSNNSLAHHIIQLINQACANTYKRVLLGPEGTGLNHMICGEFGVDEILKKIIDDSVTEGKVFDLETNKLSDDIITSTETDTMVLTAASELIKVLTSGNQCIFIDADVNSSHQDDVTVYA